MKLEQKMQELKRHDLNCNVFSAYKYDGLTMQELLCQFFTKINECVDFSNTTLDLVNWLVNEGLNIEVAKKLDVWLNDGTLENIINVELFESMNNDINNVNYLNFKRFIKDNKINVSDNYNIALQQAINYCIENKRTLFLPNGEYNLTNRIKVEEGKSVNLNIIGESKDGVILNFINTSGLHFTSVDKIIDYSKRITQIHLSNFSIKGNEVSEFALLIEYFGYVKTENLSIYGFDNGIKLVDGSEYDDYNSQIYSNKVGVYLHKSTLDGESDMANVNFMGTRLYSNKNNIICENVREVKFDGCAIMNYSGGCIIRGGTTIVNFNSCDFENAEGTTDLTISGNGNINISNSLFANPHARKIIVSDNANLNIKTTVMDNTQEGVIVIKDGYKGKINFDRPYINYKIEGETLFDNFNKDSLMNTVNYDFSREEFQGYGVNAYYKVNKSHYITSGKSMELEGFNQDKFISLKVNYPGVKPTLVETIVKNNSSNNIVRVTVGGVVYFAYEIGGMDICVQEFKNGFKRILTLLPQNVSIESVSLLFRNNIDVQYLDTFKIYGNVPNGLPLVGGSKPTKGVWQKGDVIKNNNMTGGSYSGWVCVDTNNTFKGYGLLEV